MDLQIIVETKYIPLSGYLDVKKLRQKLKKGFLKCLTHDTEIFNQILPFFTTNTQDF